MLRHFKAVLLGSAAMAVGAGTAAHADTINFSQFSYCTTYDNPVSGTTTGGVDFTLTSPNGYVIGYEEGTHTKPCQWLGVFPPGAPILFDGSGPGAVGISFTTPITSLTVAAQANYYGAYTETIDAFNAADTLISSAAAAAFNYVATSKQNTVTFLTVTGAISSVTVGTTNDGAGLALYGGAGAPPVPEPASATLFGGALAAFGAWRRRRRRR